MPLLFLFQTGKICDWRNEASCYFYFYYLGVTTCFRLLHSPFWRIYDSLFLFLLSFIFFIDYDLILSAPFPFSVIHITHGVEYLCLLWSFFEARLAFLFIPIRITLICLDPDTYGNAIPWFLFFIEASFASVRRSYTALNGR